MFEINGSNPVYGGDYGVQKPKKVPQKKLNSLFGGKKSAGGAEQIPKQSNLTRLDGGVTKYDNEYSIFKDAQGNTVYRVDYNNNNPQNIFDEEEVRTPDGKLLSYTERRYSADEMYYKKREYDENGKLTRITETTCDASGKPIKTVELPVEDEPALVGHVSIGRPVDGVNGDPGLKEIMSKWGAFVVGRK